MTLIRVRTCDVCQRPITGRVVEVRMVVVVDEADGRHHEHDVRAETCSPACSLTAARAAIERADADERAAIHASMRAAYDDMTHVKHHQRPEQDNGV